MIKNRLKSFMRDLNPWWEGEDIVVPEYKRFMFKDIQKYIKTKQIIAIVGLRRVGKTILMKQIIKEIVQKIDKENVFYFLFDEIITQKPEILEDLLNYYLKTISKTGKKYIFLDEIQKFPHWRDILKRFYDTRGDIKFIVSGSASLEIKKSKESLAGRIFDFYMPTLTFREFLEFNDIKTENVGLDNLEEFYEKNVNKIPIFEKKFIDYIIRGAFPEIAREEDEEIVKKYVRSSVLDKIILEDIPEVFEVRRKDVLSLILEYCSKETSNLLDISKLSRIVNANYQTTKSYLFYLKNSFLIDIVYNYSGSISKQLRKNKKVHIIHPSITTTMMRYTKDVINVNEVISKYVESMVFQHSKFFSERIFFWRTPQKEEVDVIIDLNGLVPIEVKYRKNVDSSDIDNMIKFMKKYKISEGIVITKDLFKEETIKGKKILFFPAWLFLLLEWKVKP